MSDEDTQDHNPTNTHPASSGGPYEIPDLAGDTADIADEFEFNYAQAAFDMEKH
jgi:hypothetical protein